MEETQEPTILGICPKNCEDEPVKACSHNDPPCLCRYCRLQYKCPDKPAFSCGDMVLVKPEMKVV